MSSSNVWFITGASSGFGRATTELALAKGDRVVATLRKPEVLNDLKAKYASDKLLVVKLDVTKHQEILDAFAQAKRAFGKIDIVFNNAGYAIFGEVESVPDETARAMFETNFWGAANVMREAIRFFREENAPGVGGKLLNNSSMVGIAGFPITSYYASTKFALEGLTDGLAKELDPEWNIKITLVEPGATNTTITETFTTTPAHPAYAKPDSAVTQTRGAFQTMMANGAKTEDAVEVLYRLSQFDQPPLRFPLGKDAVQVIRTQIAAITADVDKYESWSEKL